MEREGGGRSKRLKFWRFRDRDRGHRESEGGGCVVFREAEAVL